MLLTSGCVTTSKLKFPEAIRYYWGTKEQCIQFLQGPNAQSDRYLVEAIGE